MPAPGATLTSPDSITCRLCRHEIPLDASNHRPRRCPACKAWLAVRQPALLRKVSEGFVSAAREHTTDQDDQERVDDEVPAVESAVEMGQGWRAVSNASLFHRFDESMMATVPDPPRAVAPEPVAQQPTPDADDALAPRRALTFAFKAPEVREQPPKEVTPVVWRDELAHRERLETSDDDAIEAWLDAAESDVFEQEEFSEPLFTDVSFDASLDPAAKLVEIDLNAFPLQVHREELEVHTLELEREPERFELKLGEQHIGPLDREGVNALIASGLEHDALIRCQGQQRWGVISEHDAFQALYELGAPQGIPGQEVEEAGSETMLLVPDDEPSDTLLGMPHEHEPGDTLMMFADSGSSAEFMESAELPAPELDSRDDIQQAQPLHTTEEELPLSFGMVQGEVTSEQVSPEEEPDVSSARRRSIWRVMAIVFGALLVFALGSFAGAVVIESRMAPEDGPGARSAQELLETMIMLPRERAAYQAVRGARTVVHLSSNQKFMTPTRQHEVALELVDMQDHVAALKVFGVLWTHAPARTPSMGLTYARSAQQLGQHDVARRVLIDSAGLKGAEAHAEELGVAFNASVKRDEALHPEVLTLERDVHLDVARALGGGKSISLKLMKDGEVRYAFKPSQLDWAEGWRAEVAAYLFCEAIGCHFKVPRSLPARISREDFDELYGRFTSTKQRTYAEQFDEKLLWVKEPGADGVEREYLYGVVKDWMPGFVDFPIEYKDIWDDWLDASKDPSVLNRDLRDALSSLRVRQDGKYFAAMMDERRGASTRDVARGISDILVFDYVTSNWDRYSGVETYYGVNNQFDEGEFLSLDNGAAFHILTQRKVEQRFEPVERFSRSTISAMRLIQADSVNDVLFPEPGQEARQRLDVFWVQRDRLLARVDDLVQTHGESKVLFFE